MSIFKRKKEEPEQPEEYTITSVKDAQGGWVIEYEGCGRRFESLIFRALLNGEMRPRPAIGDTVYRIFRPGYMYIPPCHELIINGYVFMHNPASAVGRVI